MRKLFYILMFLGLVLSSSQAREDSGMEPRLGIIFPLKQQGKEVVFTRNVLWNTATVIPVGAQARMIFFPNDKDQSMYRHGRRTELKKAFMRKTHEDQLDFTKVNLKKQVSDQIVSNEWENEGHFRAVLERMERDNMYLVFKIPGTEAEDIEIEAPEFPEGLFLGQQDDRIVILSVVKNSESDRLEIKAGMFLKEINHTPVGNDLLKVGSIYAAKRKEFGEANQTLSMTFETDAGVVKVVEFKPPASLQSDFWSQFPEANKNTGGVRVLDNNPNTPEPVPAQGEDKPKI